VTEVLSAEVIAAIDDLELAARLVVEGIRSGGNRSPFSGFTTEFRQHRPYRAGDDLKHLDWKLYGRSDRLYTRQFRETTNLAVMLVVDASASMAYPELGATAALGATKAGGVTKARYACIVAAALAHLALEQGHTVGCITMERDRLSYLPARAGVLHRRALLSKLDALRPEGRWDAPRVITRGAQLLARRGLVLVISDLYDDAAATQRALRQVAQQGHDVAVLHLLAAEERALTWNGQVVVQDLEVGEERLVDAAGLTATYRARMDAFVRDMRRDAVAAGLDYALLTTDRPPAEALRDFLRRRAPVAAVP
jgi:uncharacterized protein (DUF58 family)